MDILYSELKAEDICDDVLFGFDRFLITEKVKYMDNGIVKEKFDYFVEQWDNAKLIELSKSFKDIVSKGGTIIIARDKNLVVGFAALVNEIFFDGYMNLDIIQVANKYRHKGIGRNIFCMIETKAKRLGAKKLYISSHPNIYTQMFYKNMGCVLAKKINLDLYENEPLDIQLEKAL